VNDKFVATTIQESSIPPRHPPILLRLQLNASHLGNGIDYTFKQCVRHHPSRKSVQIIGHEKFYYTMREPCSLRDLILHQDSIGNVVGALFDPDDRRDG